MYIRSCFPLLAALALLCAGSPAHAEDGYEFWLRYRLEENAARRNEYMQYCGGGVVAPESFKAGAACLELKRALPAILGKAFQANDAKAGSIYVGGRNAHPAIASLVSGDELAGVREEGFVLRTGTWEGRTTTIIAANTPRGVLYGTFELLHRMQLGEPLADMHVVDAPKLRYRFANHWDNPVRGSIERGYGGKSIFDWNALPKKLDPRLNDWARMLASMRLNAAVINNVNTAKNGLDGWRLLTPEYLPKLEALAGVLRPYGVKLYISVNFFSPTIVGSLDTADPADQRVRDWWKDKASEIYKAIPDFGGFLVKADSEGEPGPLKYKRTHAEGANMLAEALAPHGGYVYWRAFVYNAKGDRTPQAYNQFKPLDGKFAKNVFLQIKNGPVDFQVREPISTLFGAMPRTELAVELQITQEYTGQDKHVCYLAQMWSDVLRFPLKGEKNATRMWNTTDAIAGVMNINDARNWTGHLLAQANTYAFGRLAWNPDASPDAIASDWTRLTFGRDPAVVKTIASILRDSWPAYENYTAPFGIGMLCDRSKHLNPAPASRGSAHRANEKGFGTNRSVAKGSGYAGQFSEPWRSIYENPEICPEELLLFFHHVPYTRKLKDGTTLIQAFYNKHNEGVATARDFVERWKTLRGRMDKDRYQHVLKKLSGQVDLAEQWRQSINDYFEKRSGIPDAKDAPS